MLNDAVRNRLPRILVVDDEPDILMIIQDILLQGLNVSVEVTADPYHALARAKTGECDLIITDGTMENLPGPDLIRAILNERADVKCILFTGNDTMCALGRAIGAHAVLRKPSGLFELLPTICRVGGSPFTQRGSDSFQEQQVH